jgi:hypothetical protein
MDQIAPVDHCGNATLMCAKRQLFQPICQVWSEMVQFCRWQEAVSAR